MRVSSIAFRLRMWIQIVIVVIGFWAPWLDFHSAGGFDLGRHISTLEWLAVEISRSGVASFSIATPVVIVLGALAAALGALFRVWGAAYLGYDVVHHAEMQAGSVIAAGPYRYVRNPLYIGGWFMMAAVSLLMPPSGALFTMVLVTVFYLRTILSEEAFLQAKLGDPYRAYLAAVPRLMPSLRPSLPAASANPNWPTALITEAMAIGIFVTLAFLSWTYNNQLMLWGIFASFVLSMVVRALRKTPIPTCAFIVVALAAWGLFRIPIFRSTLIGLGAALVVYALIPRKKTATAIVAQ
jgi:protein-S-isoprenylcysteine O-methyltransferase Ste14